MQDFPISRYYCMTLCQNSSIEQRSVTVARPQPPLPGYFRRWRRRNGAVTVVITSLRGLVRQFSQPSLSLDENVIARWQPPPPYHRRPWRGGGGGISDPDHQVKGESLLHVLQRIGIAFFNLLLGLCWRCQGQPADQPAAATNMHARGVAVAADQPSIFQWGNPLVVVGKPMNSCTKRLKIGRQYSDNGAYTTTTIAKRRCAVPISDIEKISTMSRRRRTSSRAFFYFSSVMKTFCC